ncbi:MAG: hypothetical protein ACKV2V_00295 [Blastocatellia bacterium]
MQKTVLKPADYDSFPAFSFSEESTGAVARRVLPGLLVPALAIGWYGVRVLRRYSLAG